jgi:hypothetical protein
VPSVGGVGARPFASQPLHDLVIGVSNRQQCRELQLNHELSDVIKTRCGDWQRAPGDRSDRGAWVCASDGSRSSTVVHRELIRVG